MQKKGAESIMIKLGREKVEILERARRMHQWKVAGSVGTVMFVSCISCKLATSKLYACLYGSSFQIVDNLLLQ